MMAASKAENWVELRAVSKVGKKAEMKAVQTAVLLDGLRADWSAASMAAL